ncbi:piwi-like protein 1 isoform X1 [Haliotis cracherodii]|uniref:piwi-like protein 1 isoform X1 n=2 Tax=Haliotis cracherodii TaxID=6455 RepID=UPI0039E8D9E6
MTNYFSLNFPRNLVLYQYHVDYNPPCESKRIRTALLYVHEELIGRVHAFDGAMLFLPIRLPNEVTEVYSTRQYDSARIRVTITLRTELPPDVPQAIQVFNIIFRRLLAQLGMKQVQRHYYDFDSRINIPRHSLQVIPGVAASILPYEDQVLLNVDVAHKMIRMDTCLDVMSLEYGRRENMDDVRRRVIGCIILTRYNNRTYRVDDIDFDLTPKDTFKLSNGTDITYQEYFQQHYQVNIRDLDQPLLVSRPTVRDRNRGQTAPIYLVPELCVITGLPDEMRADFQVMKDVAVHTRIPPDDRVARLLSFRNRLERNEQARQEVENWDFQFSEALVEVSGRLLRPEPIIHGGNTRFFYNPQHAEWSSSVRGKKLLVTVALSNWVVLSPSRYKHLAVDFVQTLKMVGPPMDMRFSPPEYIFIDDDRNETYVRALRNCVTPDIQLVVCIASNNRKDRYDAIKKFCTCERPVPSQVVLQRTLCKRQMMMSVATKIAIQLNCKLGGEAWAVEIPFTTPFMVIGIDTYHDSSVRNRSVGGVVCSINQTCTRYYSRVCFQDTHVELVNGLTTICTAALRKYQEVNGVLPQRIIIYRDGVGDGQLEAVVSHELPQVMESFQRSGQECPRVSFIVVKKRIGTRLFSKTNRVSNPPPGTLVDSVITKKEWYDFFLVSQSVRQGTVSPTHYNVIWDDSNLLPDRMQRLAYKMTHLYYNWPGTIRVPAPCQYAHKLAFLVGQSLHREPSPHLADRLYYL